MYRKYRKLMMSRSGKTKSDVTTLTPTAAHDSAGTSGQDTDSVVQKAVDAAIQSAMSMFENRLRSILDEKLTELSNRVSSAEHKLDVFESRLFDIENKHQETSENLTRLEVKNKEYEDNFKLLNSEARKAVQHINDNEQYSRRNNIRIHGLHNNSDNYVQTVIDFFNTKLNINHIEADDIETARGVSLKTQSSASDGATVQSQHTKSTTVIVRFVNRRHRDEVIRHRKLLKGSGQAISEDLTTLNLQTLNRVRNDDRVQTAWTWNGRIRAVLTNGREVTVKPHQSVQELMSN